MVLSVLTEEEIEIVLLELKSHSRDGNNSSNQSRASTSISQLATTGEGDTTNHNPEQHTHHDNNGTCSCHKPTSSTTTPSPSLPPPNPFLLPLPPPTIILRQYSDFELWFPTLLSAATTLNLVGLFLDLDKMFARPSLMDIKTVFNREINSLDHFKGMTVDGPYYFTVLSQPEYPVIWDHFPKLFLHRLTLQEQKSVIKKIMRDEFVERWGLNGGWGHRIVWAGPSREKEREMGAERMTQQEREAWGKMKRGYEKDLKEYERQVWGLGQMRGWLGGSVDRGLLRRVMNPVEGVVYVLLFIYALRLGP